MTPQLWTQFLSFQDWRLTYPDLTDEDAVLLYKAELQLFQNYQDEIRNQTINRQVQLTGDLLNLSADISTILNEGGRYLPSFTYKSNFVDGLDGWSTTGTNRTVEYNAVNPFDSNTNGWLKISLNSDFGSLYIRNGSTAESGYWTQELPNTDINIYPPEFYGGFELNNYKFGNSFLYGGKNAGWYTQAKYDIVIHSSITPLDPASVELYIESITNQFDPKDGGGAEVPKVGDPQRLSLALETKHSIDTGIVPLNPYGDLTGNGTIQIVHPLPSVVALQQTDGYHPDPLLPNGLIFYIKNIEHNIWSYNPR